MNLIKEKYLALTKGLVKKIIVKRKHDARTFGTDNSRYCYSVWLRHLTHINQYGFNQIDSTIAELGPGESIGIGLSALLTGCKKYYALDVIKYWDVEKNLIVFDKLIELFANKTNIPDNNEFPNINPVLDNYDFPDKILNDDLMKKMLSPERIKMLRKDIINLENKNSEHIHFYIPWSNSSLVASGSVDYIYSQAVLEYVEDLDDTYFKLNKILNPKGFMSHCIDFSCHGLTQSWNGHWIFSEKQWRIVNGNKKVIVNRAPKSAHIKNKIKNGFDVLISKDVEKESIFSQKYFHDNYKNFTTEDTNTFASFIVSQKKSEAYKDT